MMNKQENTEESTCNACGQIRKYIDEDGICTLCKKSYGGKEIRENIGNYPPKSIIESFSKTGDYDENAYLR